MPDASLKSHCVTCALEQIATRQDSFLEFDNLLEWLTKLRKVLYLRLLLVEIRLFHRIVWKAFQSPTHGRLWCGKWFIWVEICLWASKVPAPSIPPWKKSDCGLSKAETKASVRSPCFILELSASEPMQSSAGLVAARPAWPCAPGRERMSKD